MRCVQTEAEDEDEEVEEDDEEEEEDEEEKEVEGVPPFNMTGKQVCDAPLTAPTLMLVLRLT